MTSKEKEAYYKGLNDGIDIMTTELAKYKKAFEILKELLSLDKDTSLDGKVVFYTLYFTGEIPYENYERLEKEEYELLEELMKDAKD